MKKYKINFQIENEKQNQLLFLQKNKKSKNAK